MSTALTVQEADQLQQCETVIEKGQQTFFEVGEALNRIRLDRLFRDEFETFEAYCQERWGWSRQRASQLIIAAQVVTETKALSTRVDIPTERVARELKSVPAADRPKVIDRAQKSGGLTAASVRETKQAMARPASMGQPIDWSADIEEMNKAARKKNGSAGSLKKAEALYGQLRRLIHDAGIETDEVGEALEVIAKALKGMA
jgi:hypothetical protein